MYKTIQSWFFDTFYLDTRSLCLFRISVALYFDYRLYLFTRALFSAVLYRKWFILK